MKVMNFAMAAAALLILPAMLCSCGTSGKADKKEEVATAKQEPKAEPEAAEMPTEMKPDNAPAATEIKETPKPAPAVKKAESKPAPAVKKAESKPAPAAKEKQKYDLPCRHLVRTGDNLWNLSRKYYGSGSQWKQIYEANKADIKKPEFLEPGTVLTIPANSAQ